MPALFSHYEPSLLSKISYSFMAGPNLLGYARLFFFPIKKLKQWAGIKNITFSMLKTRLRSDHQTVGHPGHNAKFSKIFYVSPQERSMKNRTVIGFIWFKLFSGSMLLLLTFKVTEKWKEKSGIRISRGKYQGSLRPKFHPKRKSSIMLLREGHSSQGFRLWVLLLATRWKEPRLLRCAK